MSISMKNKVLLIFLAIASVRGVLASEYSECWKGQTVSETGDSLLSENGFRVEEQGLWGDDGAYEVGHYSAEESDSSSAVFVEAYESALSRYREKFSSDVESGRLQIVKRIRPTGNQESLVNSGAVICLNMEPPLGLAIEHNIFTWERNDGTVGKIDIVLNKKDSICSEKLEAAVLERINSGN